MEARYCPQEQGIEVRPNTLSKRDRAWWRGTWKSILPHPRARWRLTPWTCGASLTNTQLFLGAGLRHTALEGGTPRWASSATCQGYRCAVSLSSSTTRLKERPLTLSSLTAGAQCPLHRVPVGPRPLQLCVINPGSLLSPFFAPAASTVTSIYPAAQARKPSVPPCSLSLSFSL